MKLGFDNIFSVLLMLVPYYILYIISCKQQRTTMVKNSTKCKLKSNLQISGRALVLLTRGRVSSNLTGGNFFLKLKIFRYNTIDKYYLVSCNGVYKSNQDFMSQIPFMVRLKHVAHMATLRLICPVVLLLKYYQIKIFAILFYAI